ncbi:MAG: hypothetical protein ACRC9V_01195, partial [Aeromonas sp.]
NRHDEANALRTAALILYPTDPQLMRSAALATKLASRPATMNSVSAASGPVSHASHVSDANHVSNSSNIK